MDGALGSCLTCTVRVAGGAEAGGLGRVFRYGAGACFEADSEAWCMLAVRGHAFTGCRDRCLILGERALSAWPLIVELGVPLGLLVLGPRLAVGNTSRTGGFARSSFGRAGAASSCKAVPVLFEMSRLLTSTAEVTQGGLVT